MIIVAGSLNVDYVVRVARQPLPGETLLGGDYARYTGGKGANQAVAAARAGGAGTVRMAGCVGSDDDGVALRRALEQDGIDATAVRQVAGPSGAAFITVDDAGQNAIVVAPGANGRFEPSHLEQPSFAGTRVVVLQLEVPQATVRAAARLGRGSGAAVMLNAAPMRELAADDLADVSMLVVNEHEAGLMAGRAAPRTAAEAQAAAALLRERVATIVITLGEHGAVWCDDDVAFHTPAFPVRAVDTTGAGDAFVGALAVAIAENRPAREAMRFACAAGALAATKPGAQSSMPTRAELQALLD